jgi:CHAT domain-containing protein
MKLYNGLSLSNALRDAQLWIRSLNEAQVFEALKSLIATTRVSGHTVSDGVLASFAERRLTYRPFSHTADWAAFFLAGRT